jgi:hypothetical protein
MKRRSLPAVLLLAALAAPAGAQMASVRETALARISRAQRMAADPQLVRAVTDKNASHETMEQIHARDEAWTKDPHDPLRATLTQSACAERLRDLTRDDPLIVEVILMDAQGANVCVSRETSDYWQGDEAKWQEVFTGGREAFVDQPALDASSGTYAIQLSVPVRSGSTRIGALCLTLRLRKGDLDTGASGR